MKQLISVLIMAIILCSALIVPTNVSAKSSAGVKEGYYMNEDKWISLSKNTTGSRYFVDAKGNPVNLFSMARSQSYASD